MIVPTLSYGFCAACFTAIALYVLTTGRSKDATRRNDPLQYWLIVAAAVAAAALNAWMFARAIGGDETIRFGAAYSLAPVFLYLFLRSLLSGEIVFGNNRFPRRGRAQAYWTILLLCLVAAIVFAGTIVYAELGDTR